MVFRDEEKYFIIKCFEEKGWRGQKIINEFPGKKWNRQSINRVIKQFEETRSTKRRVGSGRPKSVSTEENVAVVVNLSCSQENAPGTHLSQRQISKDLGITRSSVQVIQKKAGLKAFKRIKVSRRDDKVKGKRKSRCRKLLDKFSTSDVRTIIFTDEKDFSVEIAKNHHNDAIYGTSKKDIPVSRLYHESSRFSKKIMVSAGISWKGKTNIHIYPSGEKVNTTVYTAYLQRSLLPDCRRLYGNNYIFQQDGASAHTSEVTQSYLKDSTPNFISKTEWPPQSPDANPMDYAIWNILAEKVYAKRNEKFSEDDLIARIKEAWDEIDLQQIRNSISSWKKRLRLIIKQNGGHIDHLL